ncbi:MAG TPA: Na+/H+ antiporter NhaA [Ignavibacteria bacterium]|nr:Na+/H+ antiporter NhaA [Ignavibacteria bacterium]
MIDKYLVTPFQRFIRAESSSGILLFGATIIALVWANSPISESYQNLWQFKIGISSEAFELKKPLILWINDGLMAIFFFLIGLEIKRELLIGELNSFKKASFPLFAAIGGMIFPVAFFFILNKNPETLDGWGIPMATDIAFSLAILRVLGNRIPLSLKIFLTAFAIVDDIGAVLVIAIFYSESINWMLILISMIPLATLFILSSKGIYLKYLVLLFGIVIWVLFLKSGIHPTVAGVLLAFAIPIRQKIDTDTYIEGLSKIEKRVKETKDINSPILTKEQINQLDRLETWTAKVQSPLQHLEHRLHSWAAYFIMPVFALSNAGVSFSKDMDFDFPLVINIIISLVVGKCIGVSLMSFISVKLKAAELPSGIKPMQIIGIALLAGVGFTMSIFIANLAFAGSQIFIDSSKVGILAGSVIAGIGSYIILRINSKEM